MPAEPALVQLPPNLRALAALVAEAIGSARLRLGLTLTESLDAVVRGPGPKASEPGPAGRHTASDDLINDPGRSGIPPDPQDDREPVGDRESATGMDSDHAETWALVRRVQDGDGEAFGQLYDRYVNQVFRFIYYRVNDRALAEDFTSETFLRALRRIGTINYQGRDIGAWFMTIARNIVFDHAKSARFRLEVSTGDAIEPGEPEAGPETAVLAHLTNARLMAAVNRLNDEQKECIVLRFLQGLSVAETAAVMGKNDGAIKALQHRAVKRLATMVADDLR